MKTEGIYTILTNSIFRTLLFNIPTILAKRRQKLLMLFLKADMEVFKHKLTSALLRCCLIFVNFVILSCAGFFAEDHVMFEERNVDAIEMVSFLRILNIW